MSVPHVSVLAAELAARERLSLLPPRPELPHLDSRDELLGLLAGDVLPRAAAWLCEWWPVPEPNPLLAQVRARPTGHATANDALEHLAAARAGVAGEFVAERRELEAPASALWHETPEGWKLATVVPGMSTYTDFLSLWAARCAAALQAESAMALGMASRAERRAARDREQDLVPLAVAMANARLQQLRDAITQTATGA